MAAKSAQPIAPSDRIISLDVLRGVAVLGILIINMQSFAMIEAAYLNPTAYGDLTGLNKWAWILSFVFGDQKFMTIFSIMFGAGIVMMAERVASRNQSPASIHYRRMLGLFLIGMLHAYLFWHGDILVAYAICASLAFFFRKLAPAKLAVFGLILIAVASGLYFLFGWSMQFWPPEALAQNLAMWRPGPEIIAKEITALQGSWVAQMAQRVPASLKFQTFVFLIWTGWRAGGLMLIGMALYKWGVLTAERSPRFYRVMLAAGLLVGLPVVIYGVVRNFAAGWAYEYSMFFGWQFNYWGSLFVSLAYVAAVMLICKSGMLTSVTRRLAAVGRTALSCYLLQTLIATTIFYGHGLGLFGTVERTWQLMLVVAIWLVLLIVAPLWLRHFRFGPVEWLWRSATYWEWQPLRKPAVMEVTKEDEKVGIRKAPL